jgi:hypothetical protein
LHAIIFVCICDAPGGFIVLGQTKGKSGTCPVCIDGTTSVHLPSSKKLVFIRHERFLPRKHKYRKMKSHFDNTIEKDSAPKQHTRKIVFKMVKNIEVVFGKGTIKGQKRKKIQLQLTYLLRSNQCFSTTFRTGRIFKLAIALI